ncbi:F0F1 ATP synthase subunit epsilon [Rhodobacteraceae bacterium NNCM2]|nr:F0F1 ATP synthase subunit epsilon [Coraliihabitans acroporae]
MRIVTPLSVVLDKQIDSLRAEDPTGSFGILPGHAPMLTTLTVSIVSWKEGLVERFCAVRGGTLTVTGRTEIAIATREAVLGDDLTTLDQQVLARFRAETDAEKVENVEAIRLQMNVIRQMITRLKPGMGAESFR